jgi:hypothetical protein
MCQLCPFNPFLVSDLDRPFCHPGCMVSFKSVTPVHHAMCMVSFAWWTGNVRRERLRLFLFLIECWRLRRMASVRSVRGFVVGLGGELKDSR